MKKLLFIFLLAPLFVFGQTKIKFNQVNPTLPANFEMQNNGHACGADSIKLGSPPDYVAPSGFIFYFGDSITIYTGASDSTKSWTYLVSKALGLTSRNYGSSGAVLEKRSPLNPTGTTNMVDEISLIPTYSAGTTQWLIFSFGINDWNYAGTNYTPTNFITDYTTVMNAVVSKGWPMSRVIITSLGNNGTGVFGTTGGGGGTCTQANKTLFN